MWNLRHCFQAIANSPILFVPMFADSRHVGGETVPSCSWQLGCEPAIHQLSGPLIGWCNPHVVCHVVDRRDGLHAHFLCMSLVIKEYDRLWYVSLSFIVCYRVKGSGYGAYSCAKLLRYKRQLKWWRAITINVMGELAGIDTSLRELLQNGELN